MSEKLTRDERRERIATAIATGLYASPKNLLNGDNEVTAHAYYAVAARQAADALIAELDKKEDT